MPASWARASVRRTGDRHPGGGGLMVAWPGCSGERLCPQPQPVIVLGPGHPLPVDGVARHAGPPVMSARPAHTLNRGRRATGGSTPAVTRRSIHAERVAQDIVLP